MSRIVTIMLIYHRHKPTDLMKRFVCQMFILNLLSRLTLRKNNTKCYFRGSVVLSTLADVFLPAFGFLLEFYFRLWRWSRYVVPKRRTLPTTWHYNPEDRTHQCKNETKIISNSVISIRRSLRRKQAKCHTPQSDSFCHGAESKFSSLLHATHVFRSVHTLPTGHTTFWRGAGNYV
jgi:hypothetical protein